MAESQTLEDLEGALHHASESTAIVTEAEAKTVAHVSALADALKEDSCGHADGSKLAESSDFEAFLIGVSLR